MTNIWAQSFKEIRKPFFDTESLEEERAKKDYDGDGEIESDAKEYRGVIHNAIQKKKGLKPDGKDTSSVKEEVEEVDEGMDMKSFKAQRSKVKRSEKRAAEKTSPTRRAGMSPYERAVRHRASVDPDYDRGSEERDYPGGVSKNPKKIRKAKALGEIGEEAETLTEIDKTKENERKLDVRKGITNKVVVSPEIKEEVEAWVGELVEEGYDLSEFTWEEMSEIYESADLHEGSADIPPAGDAQTEKTTTAKRKAAQARIRYDIADTQLQRATSESFDSIVEYLSKRPDAFENLEEGVFDPKKSKLRPASERMQRTMTDSQRKAAKKEAERTSEIHSKGETVLAGLRSSGTKGKVKTTPDSKPAAPKANRTVKGRYDKLAAAANKVLKSVKAESLSFVEGYGDPAKNVLGTSDSRRLERDPRLGSLSPDEEKRQNKKADDAASAGMSEYLRRQARKRRP